MNTLFLFPDTNLFVQCRSLKEINWSQWAEFDEVRLIVSRPVQREIDKHKSKGNDRLSRRSRKAHSLLRRVIVSGDDHYVVRDTGPRVILLIDPCLPDPALVDRLDYTVVDDQIVGCAHRHRELNPHLDTRLLTHDSGPMASARMLSLPFVPIPDSWLLDPEPSDTQRQIGRLMSEIDRLQSVEPRFEVNHIDVDGNESDALEFERISYEELCDTEVSELMDSLTSRFPLVTEFGPREPNIRPPHGLGAFYSRFVPASEEDIARYTDEEYPEWVHQCERMLRHLHELADSRVAPTVFRFDSSNSGSRPGKDVLVTISAHGDFLIRPPQGRSRNEHC